MPDVPGLVRLEGAPRPYSWGSTHVIPDLLGVPADGTPVAELWFGAHPEAQARTRGCAPDDAAGTTLGEHIAREPGRTLGHDVVGRYGEQLPYLLKLLAPARALSLQVHPDLDRARRGFAAEEAAGVDRGAPERRYRDPNHKPEMVYALTRFEAVCGFRAPRRAIEVLAGLDTDVTVAMEDELRRTPSAPGVRRVVEQLLGAGTRPGPEQVGQVAAAAARRLEEGVSPSPRVDRIVTQLQGEHPGDPGVVVALLLNPVTLRPGEAMFVPAGAVHAYLSGFAVEIMASSDNVLRAGLTTKHVDVPELLETLDYVAAPPVRIAPETVSPHVGVYYAPVDDFELAVVTLEDDAGVSVPGRGPRVLLAVDGAVTLRVDGATADLARGEAVFVAGDLGAVSVSGTGLLVQADVP